MKIIPGDMPNQFLCFHPQTGLMIGLIQRRSAHPHVANAEDWRIELFMRVQGKASSRQEAVAFAHGAWAAVEGFGLLTPPKGLQDVQTKTVVRDAINRKIKEIDDEEAAGK